MAKTVQIGSEAWGADLQAFRDAISSITGDRDAIKKEFGEITSLLQSLGDGWTGPGGLAFSEGIDPLSSAGNQMISVISDVISRLRYAHYCRPGILQLESVAGGSGIRG